MSHYIPLQENYFRVLELEAAARDTMLRDRLIHMTLDCAVQSSPTYEALSYVWGTDPASHPLDLMTEYIFDQHLHTSTVQDREAKSQNTTVLIGNNLMAALEKLGYRNKSRLL